jgi:hypothetical protein
MEAAAVGRRIREGQQPTASVAPALVSSAAAMGISNSSNSSATAAAALHITSSNCYQQGSGAPAVVVAMIG